MGEGGVFGDRAVRVDDISDDTDPDTFGRTGPTPIVAPIPPAEDSLIPGDTEFEFTIRERIAIVHINLDIPPDVDWHLFLDGFELLQVTDGQGRNGRVDLGSWDAPTGYHVEQLKVTGKNLSVKGQNVVTVPVGMDPEVLQDGR